MPHAKTLSRDELHPGFFRRLDAERESFSSELTLVQTTRDVYASVVQLYRALGGGWTPAADTSADKPAPTAAAQ